MRRVRWTPGQDNRLRELAAQGLSWDAVAEAMHRTPGAVTHRALLLGVRRAGDLAQQMQAARRARIGWPLLDGSAEERERRFLAALLAEARACGLLTAAPAPQSSQSPQPQASEAA